MIWEFRLLLWCLRQPKWHVNGRETEARAALTVPDGGWTLVVNGVELGIRPGLPVHPERQRSVDLPAPETGATLGNDGVSHS